MPPETHATETPYFTLEGKVESRRVMRPNALGPRLEISFSAHLSSDTLPAGGAAVTFIAQPLPEGRYRWLGRGLLLAGPDRYSLRSEGWGHKVGEHMHYDGQLILQAHALTATAPLPLRFEYSQGLSTLDVSMSAYL